jgi:hypothetical protein
MHPDCWSWLPDSGTGGPTKFYQDLLSARTWPALADRKNAPRSSGPTRNRSVLS